MKKITSIIIKSSGLTVQSSAQMPLTPIHLRNMEDLAKMLLDAAKTNAEKDGDSLVLRLRTESGVTICITEGDGLFLNIE